MPTILGEARGLSKDFPVKGKKGALLHGVSQVDLQVYEGETLALVGESGCGKSVTALSVLGLVPAGGEVTAGEKQFAVVNTKLVIWPEHRSSAWRCSRPTAGSRSRRYSPAPGSSARCTAPPSPPWP